jgi:hypothetical protein
MTQASNPEKKCGGGQESMRQYYLGFCTFNIPHKKPLGIINTSF